MNHGPVWAAAAFVCLIGQTVVVLQASCEASVGDHLRVECTNKGPLISVTWLRRPFRTSVNDKATPKQLVRKPAKNLTSSSSNSCCSLRLRKSDHFLQKAKEDRKPRLSSIGSFYTCLKSFPNEASQSHTNADTQNPWYVPIPDNQPEDISVVTCQGSNVTMVCESRSNRDLYGVSWKRRSANDTEVHLTEGDTLQLDDVKRSDGGSYICEVTSGDNGQHVVTRELVLVVEYPPVILVTDKEVRGSTTTECLLQCVVDAIPEARVSWFKDDVLLGHPDDVRYKTVLKTNGNCTLQATLLIQLLNNSNSSANDSASTQNDSVSHTFGNYTCVAENEHGRSSAVLRLIAPNVWDSETEVVEERRFNVTGFIIGMMPPLFISFYIILKLGYRSRYAQEHPEDEGGREEPFFVSY